MSSIFEESYQYFVNKEKVEEKINILTEQNQVLLKSNKESLTIIEDLKLKLDEKLKIGNIL
jgi:hypothetical protein